MRTAIGILGGLFLAGLCGAEPAAAQGLPQGSYLQSCTRVNLRGDNLIAVCRRADGGEQRTSLADVYRCVGDIGNMNGTLTCNYGGGGAPPPPAYGPPRSSRPPGRRTGWGVVDPPPVSRVGSPSPIARRCGCASWVRTSSPSVTATVASASSTSSAPTAASRCFLVATRNAGCAASI